MAGKNSGLQERLKLAEEIIEDLRSEVNGNKVCDPGAPQKTGNAGQRSINQVLESIGQEMIEAQNISEQIKYKADYIGGQPEPKNGEPTEPVKEPWSLLERVEYLESWLRSLNARNRRTIEQLDKTL